MPVNVVMPQMGESVAEGTVVRWIKKIGDHVEHRLEVVGLVGELRRHRREVDVDPGEVDVRQLDLGIVQEVDGGSHLVDEPRRVARRVAADRQHFEAPLAAEERFE